MRVPARRGLPPQTSGSLTIWGWEPVVMEPVHRISTLIAIYRVVGRLASVA
jgi:hypothetical protein